MNNKIKALLEKHNMVITNENDMETAIELVADLLELQIDDTKEYHPKATNTIQRLEIAHREVRYGLLDWIEEVSNE